MLVKKEFRFCAAHRLLKNKGKCANIHGHNYKVQVELEGELGDDAMVMDFHKIISILEPIIDELDHAFLINSDDEDIIEFCKLCNFKTVIFDDDPTAEMIAKHFLKVITLKELKSIEVFETDTSTAKVVK